MKKIGIFGGSFDPIHLGHLIVAWQALCQAQLDEIIFVPTGYSPNKGTLCAGKEDRLEMLRLATADNEYFSVSRYEADKKETAYTIDTLRHFSRVDTKLYFIMGDDSLFYFEKWKEYKKILEISDLLIYNRLYTREEIEDRMRLKDIPGRIIDAPVVDISSTAIRESVRKGFHPKYMTTAAVERYIKDRGLYIED